jgi:hypothetical protein
MITMEMTAHNVRCRRQSQDNPPPYPLPFRHLQGMRQQTVTDIAKGQSRVNNYPAFCRFDQTTQSANPKRFRTDNVNRCSHKFSGAFLPGR